MSPKLAPARGRILIRIDHNRRRAPVHPLGVQRPLSHLDRGALGELPASAIAVAGKELSLDETAGRARALLARHAVKAVPVLDGRRYVGAVDRSLLERAPDDGTPLRDLVADVLPVTAASTPAASALEELDADGGTRLVVLSDDGIQTYVGIVCLRGDRARLCVDAELVQARA